ncbi:site-specific recombinase [Dyadobacter sp. BE34]|uniref:Site-specific recombinase n=1 Tax=Dyadobacter fermentans TaxID=94254 RepID=A0ABU1QR38_9BACT|nr:MULTISPECIES: hypothetical protein [Dyadobacter]MDR6803572.1 site-specific recombinase [Dyadobacter fermentans]MDR7041312.1 site-specific recombinase [Dyadobacter sp. BE242]MDR7195716.1 site-specific recombinase [Dyadobacter sp. BE34]MDR7213740.1 site-specific recombinase [Dyadobacter sp. BE31]MDR7261122.1 site-specific recombinase [Dyadobacter sp. BE32]
MKVQQEIKIGAIGVLISFVLAVAFALRSSTPFTQLSHLKSK